MQFRSENISLWLLHLLFYFCNICAHKAAGLWVEVTMTLVKCHLETNGSLRQTASKKTLKMDPSFWQNWILIFRNRRWVAVWAVCEKCKRLPSFLLLWIPAKITLHLFEICHRIRFIFGGFWGGFCMDLCNIFSMCLFIQRKRTSHRSVKWFEW